MTPSERRIALLRQLATLDQQVADVERLFCKVDLDPDDLDYLSATLDFRRSALEPVEAMLGGRRGSECD